MSSGSPGRPPDRSATSSDPELILTQALRAMAGEPGPGIAGQAPGAGPNRSRSRLSTLQVMLIATLLGLMVGITAGLLSLLL